MRNRKQQQSSTTERDIFLLSDDNKSKVNDYVLPMARILKNTMPKTCLNYNG